MSDNDNAAVAVALAEIRGELAAGFATVNGSLALLAQRGDQTDAKLTDHEQRIDDLERRRWPVPLITAAVAAGGLGLSAWTALGR